MVFATKRPVRYGQGARSAPTGAIVAPIYQTSTYINRGTGQEQRLLLRAAPITRTASARTTVAKREGATALMFFFPAMAGIDSVLFACCRLATRCPVPKPWYGGRGEVIPRSTQLPSVHFRLEFHAWWTPPWA